MSKSNTQQNSEKHIEDSDPQETQDWLDSFDAVIQRQGPSRARYLLQQLVKKSHQTGLRVPLQLNTPYINTISTEQQPDYPGDQAIEWKIRSWVRWNAMAMVVRANQRYPGIGGHISTFASAATLYEVGFNHFFQGKDADDQEFAQSGDQIFFQGHASPGIYARAFLEGRLEVHHLENFRRELEKGGGLSSYPHPWLMPDFWEFPTVSMGLGPIAAIYQARFNRYLQARGILNTEKSHVWAFLGDGETDEPEALGSLSIAAREKLDNLTFVVNCNLQRLDGPVRGNGKIIQELESIFRGAGWNVIKVIWGADWDPLLKADSQGLLVQRMGEALDGHYQKYSVEDGAYTRQDFFGTHSDLLKLVEHLSDDQIRKLRRGGHEPDKVYAAYHAACQHKGQPTVILAKTIKGYGLGESGEGRNVTHQQKKMNEEELKKFRDRFDIPIPDNKITELPFYRPDPKTEEIQYLLERRAQLGGSVPKRRRQFKKLDLPEKEVFSEMFKGSGERSVSTTMAFDRLLALLLRDEKLAQRIVPIIPDEARTFGLDPLFRQIGIYSSLGQLYEPVDKNLLLYYKESEDGQVLEEGITEAGSMASFIASATSYATHNEPMIPFYIFYSMFGFQRTGDQMWAAGDMRARGFLLGATYGRTALSGEGLQHQDGHSHILAANIPNLRAYHPAFAYEIAVIVRQGLKEMYEEQKDLLYYITLQNENYPMPAMPEGVEEAILQGLYLFKPSAIESKTELQLFGSSVMINEALRAQKILAEKYQVSANVWSVTSYQQLRREALEVERWNRLHPEQEKKESFLCQQLKNYSGPLIAVSDSARIVPDQIARFLGDRFFSLGTDGFGRSDSRENLRRFYEVDAESIVLASLFQLTQRKEIETSVLQEAIKEFEVDTEREAAWNL